MAASPQNPPKRPSKVAATEPLKSSLAGSLPTILECREHAGPGAGMPTLKAEGAPAAADASDGQCHLEDAGATASTASSTKGDLGSSSSDAESDNDPDGGRELGEKLTGAMPSKLRRVLRQEVLEEDVVSSLIAERKLHLGDGCVTVKDCPPEWGFQKLGLVGPTADPGGATLIEARQPADWSDCELEPCIPSSEMCFASLLHGDKHEYFLYACVLGRRLRDGSPGPDRVLLCGPGSCCNLKNRAALRDAGWSHVLPVEPIVALHLDQTYAKRHALVFTKLRVLELPYSKVLLLDVDLLPRADTDVSKLFDVPAPAGKFHCARYHGPEPEHGEMLPEDLQYLRWSPNAGVMRLDPEPDQARRHAQVEAMVSEVMWREGSSYLPEQYYLAERLNGWRHVSKVWNWEVWPEWDDPNITHPLPEACIAARQLGWAGYYLGSRPHNLPDASEVLEEVRIWHFSGSWDTAPWMFQDFADPQEVREYARRLFRSRDPGGVVATALYEWRLALNELLMESNSAFEPLHSSAAALAKKAVEMRSRNWACERCGEPRRRVRLLADVPCAGAHCSVQWSGLRWACADCIVEQLRAGGFKECKCAYAAEAN